MRLFAPAFILAVAVPLAALADDLPARKAGLWETTIQPPGMPKPMTSKLCTDAKVEGAFQHYGENASGMQCSKRDIKRSGNVVTVDSICAISGSTVTTHTVMTWTGDTAYHMVAQSKRNPPLAGKAESQVTQDAKWVGACPASMKPGDMQMANGMTMNILQMSQKPPGQKPPGPGAPAAPH